MNPQEQERNCLNPNCHEDFFAGIDESLQNGSSSLPMPQAINVQMQKQ